MERIYWVNKLPREQILLAENWKKTMTMNVTVKYNLSQAGQKAALIAGKTATASVTEVMSFDDPSLIDKLTINTDGTMSLNADSGSRKEYGDATLYLDAPPADLASLLNILDAHCAANLEMQAAQERERTEKREAEARAAQEKLDADSPLVDAILEEFEAMPLDAPLPVTIECVGNSIYHFRVRAAVGAGSFLSSSKEQKDRANVVLAARAKAKTEADAAKTAAKEAAKEAMIAEHGGIVFPVEGGLCAFTGQSLWSGGQSKRWVGIFTTPKGIDTFLDSARGEHSFAVGGLNRGDCIQGAGFDTNSRGKRRSETEWYGVVVRVSDTEIVVDLCDSRSATIKAAAKLSTEVKNA
jgi:hypothetical protein